MFVCRMNVYVSTFHFHHHVDPSPHLMISFPLLPLLKFLWAVLSPLTSPDGLPPSLLAGKESSERVKREA